jgi:ferric-dicitrate binding protein FerR (iron transport regulator)
MPMAEDDMPEPMPRMDQQMREASLWFARMRGPDAEEWRPQFEQWLALGASHRGRITELARYSHWALHGGPERRPNRSER